MAEVLRARPIATATLKNSSRQIGNDVKDGNDANDNDAFNSLPKSIPPSIYVDINGTLIISGKG